MVKERQMDSLSALKEFYKKLSNIPITEWARAVPLFSVQKVNKGDFYFRQGDPIEKIGTIVSGLMYVFYEDVKGREKVKRFLTGGQVVTSYVALVENKPATFSAKALETSIIVNISYQNLQMLYDRHPAWERATRKYLDLQMIEREKKEEELFLMSAQERYHSFIERHREIFNKIPQYLIASYIGVTPVALSRIRQRRRKSASRHMQEPPAGL